MNKKLLAIPALMLVATIGLATKASADSVNAGLGANLGVNSAVREQSDNKQPDNNKQSDNNGARVGMMQRNGGGIFGTVTAISGSTITVQTKAYSKGNIAIPAATYTVNVGTATSIDKNKTATTISGIAIGDSIAVEGSVSGSVVTAAKIHDGIAIKGMMGGNSIAAIFAGNGQPVIGGTVTAVNGNIITFANKSNVSYTADVTNAKITKDGVAAVSSTIAVGDSVLAQGTINGNAVAAVNFVDSSNPSPNANANENASHRGFFGSIGSFFAHLFGMK